MASAIGIALISTILEPMAAKAMTMVVNKVCGIVNIKRDISKLQITLHMIKSIVRVAEEKQIDDEFIRNWLRDLVDIAYEARDVLDDFITYSSITASKPVNSISSLKLSCFCGSSSDTSNIPLRILNRLGKDIRSVNERFDEKIKKSETFAILRSVVGGGGSESVGVDRRPICRPTVGPSTNKQRDGLFLGREEVKQGIMEKILHPSDDHAHVVLIWGMGGIGKTTLAQSIYNDERVKEVPRSWLSVGVNKFSAEKAIREIVNDQNSTGIGNLQTKLKEKLRGDRFLIVLDDVWDVDGSEWDLLFNPLTEVGKGGLIIITRRERELCAAITIQTAYNLQSLSEEDSWSIFESCAYLNGKADSTPDLKGIGEEIVKKLNGLPLALKVVGRSLLNKDSSTWTDFLESKFSEDCEVMSALRWSYNHLPRHLKMCFTYCSLFPKGHVFDEKVLVEMWMAHDLIQKEEQYFTELVNASLLQCVDGKYVMHDLIHDLTLLVSNGEFATANGSLSVDQMEEVRHITIAEDDYSKIPRLRSSKKLLTLYTNHNQIYTTEKFDYSVLDDVFKQLKSIRVLVLDSSKIADISDSISELRHLRYLDVRRTSVKSLPDSLCHLYNLQMLAAPLDAALPRDIVNMVDLRYVRAKLATCKGIGKLTSLQELSSIYVCKDDNIRELGDMQRLCGKLTIKGLENVEKLEDDVGALMEKQTLMDKLQLIFDKQLEKSTISEVVLDSLGCPPNLTYLKIYGYTGVKPPSWMVDGKHKFNKLQTLKLSLCPKLVLPTVSNAADFMKSLKDLDIISCKSLVQITSAICLATTIERLKISYCEQLQTMGFEELPSLKHLDVEDCNNLISIPRLVGIKFLSLSRCESLRSLSINIRGLDSLEHLHILGCPTLELAFEDGSSSSSSLGNSVAVPIRHLFTDNTQVFRTLLHHELVSLETLFITSLAGFEDFDETEANNFCKSRSLHSLGILQCEDLKSLPADFHKLSSLEGLYIYNCPQLQSLPPDFHKLSSLKGLGIVHYPQLQSLPPDFHKLSSLENLEIHDCSQLQSLSPDFHKLSSLKNLLIESCPQLQSLPADGLPPSLRYLTIYYCPLLYERCKDEFGLDWHKINHIHEREIHQHR